LDVIITAASACVPEDAVNEVKRQAMMELQKAVTAAENKASEMVMTERVKMERVLQQARSQAREELIGAINHQEESSEVKVTCRGSLAR
jgi:runt-related transcription factor 1